MCSGSETGSYLRLIGSCITQLKAQGPARTCNESKEEEEAGLLCIRQDGRVRLWRVRAAGPSQERIAADKANKRERAILVAWPIFLKWRCVLESKKQQLTHSSKRVVDYKRQEGRPTRRAFRPSPAELATPLSRGGGQRFRGGIVFKAHGPGRRSSRPRRPPRPREGRASCMTPSCRSGCQTPP